MHPVVSSPTNAMPSASTTPTRSIPIRTAATTTNHAVSESIALKRTSSELRLLEEEQQADLRDYIFFTRLVQGIANRESPVQEEPQDSPLEPSQAQDRSRLTPSLGPFSHDRDDESLQERRRRRCSPWLQRQNEICLAHIIRTRNGYQDGDHRSSMITNGPPSTPMTPMYPASRNNGSVGYHNRVQYNYQDHYGSLPQQPFYSAEPPTASSPYAPQEDIFDMDW